MAVAVVGALIALEPDYGSAAFVVALGILLLLLAGFPLPYLAGGALLVAPVVSWLYLERRDFIHNRLDGLLDPMSVYQVRHSLYGVGSGGALGKGFGLGDEKAFFLPEASNDFVFAVFAEENGFVGVVILILLFSLLLQTGWRVVRDCPQPALRLLGLGIVISIVLQAVVNVAVATASAPTKGIALPFISAGSSGLSMLLLEIGILLAISRVHVKGAEP